MAHRTADLVALARAEGERLASTNDYGPPGWSVPIAEEHAYKPGKTTDWRTWHEDLVPYPSLRDELRRRWKPTIDHVLAWCRQTPQFIAATSNDRRLALEKMRWTYALEVFAAFLEDFERSSRAER